MLNPYSFGHPGGGSDGIPAAMFSKGTSVKQGDESRMLHRDSRSENRHFLKRLSFLA